MYAIRTIIELVGPNVFINMAQIKCLKVSVLTKHVMQYVLQGSLHLHSDVSSVYDIAHEGMYGIAHEIMVLNAFELRPP